MSTRSVVARWVGEEAWIGKYVHYDGYPANMVMRLLEIVLRDGFSEAISKLVFESDGWSGLYHEPHKDLKTGKPDLDNWVEGYGYLMEGMQDRSNWITWEGDHWGTEWCYVLDSSDKSVTIFKFLYPDESVYNRYAEGKWYKHDVIDFGQSIYRIKSGETTIEDEVARNWQTLSVLEGVV